MAPKTSERTQLLRSASVLGFLTVASRVLGMVRDILCASLFGAGMMWDAFIIAWTLPNLFRRLFGEGALSSTFIPVYTETREKEGDDRARSFASGMLGVQIVLLAVLALAGTAAALFLPALADRFGVGDPKLSLTAGLSALLMPYLVFICTAALLTALLQAHRRFARAALAPVVLNVFWIAGVLLAGVLTSGEKRIFFMSAFLLAGGFVQAVMLLPPLIRARRLGWPRPAFRDPGVRTVGSLALPVILGLAVLQVNVLLDRIIAELLVPGHGAVSALYFGNRLMQFPLGVIGIAAATAVFPLLATHGAKADREGFSRILSISLKGTLFLAIPAGVGLMVLGEGVVDLLFGHGAFTDDPRAVGRTGIVLLFYAVGLPAYCGIHVVTRGFYALKDTRTPVKIATLMVGVNLALNLVLVWPMQEAGLALATAATAWLNFAACLLLLGRKMERSWVGEIVQGNARTALAAAIMAGGTFFLFRGLSRGLADAGTMGLIVSVLGSAAAGAGIYLVTCVLLREPSLAMWAGRVLRRSAEKEPHDGEE
jgi:putative peptidoglycan lipid II flippase